MCKDANSNAKRHYDKADAEYRIKLTDDLVDRNESSYEIINKDEYKPECAVCKKS